MEPVSETRGALEMKLRQRDREIDLLRRDLERFNTQWKDAEAKAAVLQAVLDRHVAHFSKDNSALQRLIAELAEANSRRREQAAVIERRDLQIITLRQEVASLKRGTAFAALAGWLRRAFSPGRA